MHTALLVVHLMIAATLVVIVLFQQSEGGALGMGGGGGGGGGGFMSGRGTANLLTRVTAGLALAFFCTSILLVILANQTTGPSEIQRQLGAPTQTGTKNTSAPSSTGDTPTVPSTGGGLLDALKSGRARDRLPTVPDGQ